MSLVSPNNSSIKSPFARWSYKFHNSMARRSSRVYILPNKQGYLFLITNFVLFNIGNVYGNNIVLLLSFLMISLAVVNMILTHLNMKHLDIQSLVVPSIFADEIASLKVKVQNNSNRLIDDLQVGLHNPEKTILGEILDVNSGMGVYQFNTLLKVRGHYQASKLKVSTRAPSQLFYAWKFLSLETNFFVYPSRKMSTDSQQYLKPIDKDGGENRDEYQEHRSYYPGIPSRSIDWKLYGKSDQLYWKKFSGSEEENFIFDYNQLKGEKEQRLQTLSYLIDTVFQQNHSWTLILPESSIGPGKDLTHWKSCLEALACY